MHWVSFYSYKGGVGRTTGLANVAYSLVKEGRTVVMIDFDFEAPGLHFWCGEFGAQGPLPEASLYELFVDISNKRSETPDEKSIQKKVTNTVQEALMPIDVADCKGHLFLLPCHGYKDTPDPRLSDIIDWKELNSSSRGTWLLSALKNAVQEEMKKKLGSLKKDVNTEGQLDVSQLQYALMDMRTGRTLSSIVLSNELSDAVVVFSSLHEQSIEGVCAFLEAPETKTTTKLKDKVIPVISPQVAQPDVAVERGQLLAAIARLTYASQGGIARGLDKEIYIEKIIESVKNYPDHVVTVPFERKLALQETLIVKQPEGYLAATSYQKLAYQVLLEKIKETYTAELRKEVKKIEEVADVLSDIKTREEYVTQIFERMKIDSTKLLTDKLILFGGISTALCNETAAASYVDWLKQNQKVRLYFCYEASDSARSRAKTLSTAALTGTETLSSIPMVRMDQKTKQIQSLEDYILKKLQADNLESCMERVYFIELLKPLTQYIMFADDDMYVTPLIHKRSSDSFSFRLKQGENSLKNDLFEFIAFHLKEAVETPSKNQLLQEVQKELTAK